MSLRPLDGRRVIAATWNGSINVLKVVDISQDGVDIVDHACDGSSLLNLFVLKLSEPGPELCLHTITARS